MRISDQFAREEHARLEKLLKARIDGHEGEGHGEKLR